MGGAAIGRRPTAAAALLPPAAAPEDGHPGADPAAEGGARGGVEAGVEAGAEPAHGAVLDAGEEGQEVRGAGRAAPKGHQRRLGWVNGKLTIAPVL